MESLSVLLVRIIVGLVLGLAGAFIGLIFNGMFVPSPGAGDELAFIVRMLVLGIGAAAGGLPPTPLPHAAAAAQRRRPTPLPDTLSSTPRRESWRSSIRSRICPLHPR